MDLDFMKLAVDDMCCFVITDKMGNYLYANRAWSAVMERPFDDNLIGRPVSEIIKDTQIDKALKEDRQISSYSTITCANGRIKRAFSIYDPIHDNHGKLVAGTIITIVTDEQGGEVERLIKDLNLYKQEIKKLQGVRYNIDNIIGDSQVIQNLKTSIRQAARTNSTVLIYGETGSGKELVANSIHDLSSRSSESFIRINCANIPRDLLESELFGYEGGAFTGASSKGKIGKFEQANKGTLFLDEINQMAYEHQPKLLRVIQEREFERVGGTKSIKTDIRFIAATNVPLQQMIYTREFRQDLYYRLNVVPIYIPPLRERKEDIPLLVDNIIERLKGEIGIPVPEVTEEVKHRLAEADYNWPGNIRELQNMIEWAINISMGETITWNIIKKYFSIKSEHEEKRELRLDGLKNAERDLLVRALAESRNKTEAAKLLGISRTMLYKKIKKYGL